MTHHLKVDPTLQHFIEDEVLPGTGIDAASFWQGFSTLVHDLAPRNRELLAERDRLQAELDNWHSTHPGPISDMPAYQAFLRRIGYLVDTPQQARISTTQVDREIAEQAGPQLVVPLSNARYALNAANARWGSLYDALYGTDAIAESDGAERGQGCNPVRGPRVIAFGRGFLDRSAPLAGASHADVQAYAINQGSLLATLGDGRQVGLEDSAQLRGYQGEPGQPTAILLQHHRLHFEIQIDAASTIGKADRAGVKDILVEAALTTIIDCEDSVAAVDAEDKVNVYRNWLGLMRGDLSEQVNKGGKTFTRALAKDR